MKVNCNFKLKNEKTLNRKENHLYKVDDLNQDNVF